MRAAVVVVVALGLGVAVGAGCGPSTECVNTHDCPFGDECSSDGKCVKSGEGSVRWISPASGSTVGDTYDAVVEVSFEGTSAVLHVDRALRDGGNPCAPSVPRDVIVGGATTDVLVQQITVPGLRSLGPEFQVVATLGAGTGNSALATLHGPASSTFGGATFSQPSAKEADASDSLTLPVTADFSRAMASAFLWTEPATGPPTPKTPLGNGILSIDTVAPLVHGPQIVWLETQGAAGDTPQLCGFGLNGTASSEDTGTGLEVGLVYEGPEAGLLNLRAQLDRPAPSVCTFTDPGADCDALFQTHGPATEAQEAVRVNAVDGDVVDLLVVPGAASAPLTATLRVTFDGQHVGFLGPISLNPGNGEWWLAGTVSVRGALVDLTEAPPIPLTGAPPF